MGAGDGAWLSVDVQHKVGIEGVYIAISLELLKGNRSILRSQSPRIAYYWGYCPPIIVIVLNSVSVR